MAAGPHTHTTSSDTHQAQSRMTNPDQETYYQLLNVPVGATATQITRAYREAIKRSHPDRVRPEFRAQAEDICKDLNAAYRILHDPAKRLAYDRSIRPQEIQDQIMRRYVATGGPPTGTTNDPYADSLRRQPGAAERKDRIRSERSAMWSLLSAFLVIALGLIGLILAFALVSFVARQLI